MVSVTTKKQSNINNIVDDLFATPIVPSSLFIPTYKNELITYKIIDDKTSDDDILAMMNNVIASPVASIDTEATGLCPHLNKVRLVQISILNPVKENYIIDTWKVRNIEDLLNGILTNEKTIKILQNAKYDYKMLKGSFGVTIKGNIFDTMIAQQIINYHQKASLEAIAFNWINEKLDKTNQRSDWSKPELSEDQLLYSVKDVLLLHDIRDKMRQVLIDEGLVNIARIELNAIKPLAEMEYNGFSINEPDYLSACSKLELCLSENLKNNKSNEYLKYAKLSSAFGVKFLSQYLNKKTRNLHLNIKQISDEYGNIKFYDFNLSDLINTPQLPDFHVNDLINCFQSTNSDETLMSISFYIVNIDSILNIIRNKRLKMYIDKKGNRETAIMYSLSGRKMCWNGKKININSKEVHDCLYSVTMNDLTKELSYLIYEELVKNKSGDLIGLVNNKIYLKCNKEKSIELKEKIKYIIYDLWDNYCNKYGFQNPIIPEVHIINKLSIDNVDLI